MDEYLATQPPTQISGRVSAGGVLPSFGTLNLTRRDIAKGRIAGTSLDASRRHLISKTELAKFLEAFPRELLSCFAPKVVSQTHRVHPRRGKYKRQTTVAFTTPVEHLFDAIVFSELIDDPVLKRAVELHCILSGDETWTKVTTLIPIKRGKAKKSSTTVTLKEFQALQKGNMRKDALLELHGDEKNLEPTFVLCLTVLGQWKIVKDNDGVEYKEMIKYYSKGIPCSALSRTFPVLRASLRSFLIEYLENQETRDVVKHLKAVQLIRWAMVLVLTGQPVPVSIYKLACLSTKYNMEDLTNVIEEVAKDRSDEKDFSSEFIKCFTWEPLDATRYRPVEVKSFVETRTGLTIESSSVSKTNSRLIKHEIRLSRIPIVEDLTYKKMFVASHQSSEVSMFSSGGLSASTVDLVSRMTDTWSSAKVLFDEYISVDMTNATNEYLSKKDAPITMLRECVGSMLVAAGKLNVSQAPFPIQTQHDGFPWIHLAICSMNHEEFFKDYPQIVESNCIENLMAAAQYEDLVKEVPILATYCSLNS